MKKRLLRVLILALVGPLLIIGGAGLLSARDFSGTRRAVLNASIQDVWHLLNDLEGLPKRNPSVLKVEVLEWKGSRPTKWREALARGQEAVVAVTEWVPNERIQWSVLDSSFGMTGTWTVRLSAAGAKTEVELSEASRCDAWLTRAVLAVAGRDTNLKRMLMDFEKALK